MQAALPKLLITNGTKRPNLRADLSSKTFIYLDVCHWINLRHVLASKAQRRFRSMRRLVDRLNLLAQEQIVLCPLSTAIFDELMSRPDPLSTGSHG